ncbi:MAG TPA: hypothetical protein VF350_04110 [Candidatus Bathyarchaeia archaeon]
MKNKNTKGIIQRKPKLRKLNLFEASANSAREIIKLMFGSLSHVRVKKKISNNITAFSASSGIDFGGLR